MFEKLRISGMMVLALAAVGCRDGFDSFVSATTPTQPLESEGQWAGDPYASAGVAEASGGTITRTHDARSTARRGGSQPHPGKLDPAFDQPAKGTGAQPGDYPMEANPGTGHSNAPANQPLPEQVDDTTVRRGQ